uniref:Uncharacterized protein n=1 Tax=Triticum urartu TaxID=4572 RepID=A0A8R7UI02_TRIUA
RNLLVSLALPFLRCPTPRHPPPVSDGGPATHGDGDGGLTGVASSTTSTGWTNQRRLVCPATSSRNCWSLLPRPDGSTTRSATTNLACRELLSFLIPCISLPLLILLCFCRGVADHGGLLEAHFVQSPACAWTKRRD